MLPGAASPRKCMRGSTAHAHLSEHAHASYIAPGRAAWPGFLPLTTFNCIKFHCVVLRLSVVLCCLAFFLSISWMIKSCTCIHVRKSVDSLYVGMAPTRLLALMQNS